MAKQKKRVVRRKKVPPKKWLHSPGKPPRPGPRGGEIDPTAFSVEERRDQHVPTLAEMLANTLPAPDWRKGGKS
jgi:hypothetical protein